MLSHEAQLFVGSLTHNEMFQVGGRVLKWEMAWNDLDSAYNNPRNYSYPTLKFT